MTTARRSSRPSPPRRPGRPSGQGTGAAAVGPEGSSAAQRERLLDAAVSLFSECGVAATQFKAIALRAGVTPALIHYYFGDRDGLLDAVADERLGPLIDRAFSPGEDANLTPSVLLPDIAERLIRAAVAAPWFPPLWLREIVQSGGELRERVLQRVGLQRVGAVAGTLSAAQARGQLNPALAPPLMMVSMIGLALLPLATPHIWRRLPGAEAVDTDAIVRHVRALLAHGLTGPSAQSL